MRIKEYKNMIDKIEIPEDMDKELKNVLFRNRKEKAMKKRKRFGWTKIVVAASLLLVVGPVAVNAATDGELMERLFGNKGKTNIESHQYNWHDEGKDVDMSVTLPKREYEAVDSRKAKDLMEDSVMRTEFTKDFSDGTQLKILSIVRDENSVIVEFTLENKNGVDHFVYNEHSNEGKGAWFSEDSPFWFRFDECDGMIYIDEEKTTDTKIYCYDYMTVWETNDKTFEELTLYITERVADSKEDSDLEEEWKESHAKIKIKPEIQMKEFQNEKNGSLEISPISMKIDMQKVSGLEEEGWWDPYYNYLVSIQYKDGSTYLVRETDCGNLHTCSEETENTSYVCGSGQYLNLIFNRLVDVDMIESITVNETEYRLK